MLTIEGLSNPVAFDVTTRSSPAVQFDASGSFALDVGTGQLLAPVDVHPLATGVAVVFDVAGDITHAELHAHPRWVLTFGTAAVEVVAPTTSVPLDLSG